MCVRIWVHVMYARIRADVFTLNPKNEKPKQNSSIKFLALVLVQTFHRWVSLITALMESIVLLRQVEYSSDNGARWLLAPPAPSWSPPTFSALRMFGCFLFIVNVAIFTLLLTLARQRRLSSSSASTHNNNETLLWQEYNLNESAGVDEMLRASTHEPSGTAALDSIIHEDTLDPIEEGVSWL